MANFGTLEYVLDKFSGTWSWKITGERAVAMVSRIMPQAWYGEGEYEAIVPDDPKHIRQIKWIMDRYPLEILSKNVWQKKLPPSAKQVTKKPKKIERLNLANPGKQFKGTLFNFQREGLDFLIKSSGNALLADEMGLGKCVRGDSLIKTVNGQIAIGDLWKNSQIIEQNYDEAWAKLPKPLIIQTFDGQKIVAKKVDKIFRQKISEPIAKITLWNGSAVECTKRHRFLTPDGWKMAGELTVNDTVGIPAQKIANNHTSLSSLKLFPPSKYTQGMSKELTYFVIDKLESTNHSGLASELQKLATEAIHWCGIKEIQTKKYDGFVYDLSVPDTHNYIVNDIITHNTIQTLAYLSTEKDAFPALIVAPLVTLQNWQREIEKFLKRKSRNGRLLENEPPTTTIIRVGKSEDLGKFDFYIINYELLYKRYKDLAKLNLRTIVCDEVQHLRSKTTQKYHAVKKLSALSSVKYRIGLSGTPIYNRGSEIWPIVDILRPGLLGNFKEFCEYFCYINEKGKAIVLENKRESLRQMLQKHVMLRRKKSDVLTELKEKVRYKEIIDADINYYNMELEKIWKKLEEERKVAQTAFDASTAYQRAIQSERQAAGIAKLPHVINFVKNIMEIEESVVVFCHHKSIHTLLHQSLAEFKPASIIGGQSDKERQANIDAFQNGETKLMIAGLRAGNVGINLTRARYVIFAELDWSPAIHLQAEDRLHRLGQKNTVFAYYLIGNGTLDEHVAQVLVDKSYEIDSIMDSKTESFENKEKAKLILAQIQDKIKSIMKN
ncbi:MAG TPA: SNF2-related protein [Candidatus Nitrosotenuis sp.]|nr:SNF2-related protein [Candidatus Nitrosotenuis sp.]